MQEGKSDPASGTEWPPPLLIAWELTRSCPLRCVHCRAAAGRGPFEGEFTTAEALRFVDNVASFAKPILILTGGEPMLRADFLEIARAAADRGLRPVAAPCGALVTEQACRDMKDAGIQRISLSIDGADAASHDAFRGVPGAFEQVLAAAKAARATGLEFQINTTVTRRNAADLPRLLDLALELGAVAFHPFLLVPTGRAATMAAEEIPPDEYERVLGWLAERRDVRGLELKPTCAPHYNRVVRQAGGSLRGGHGRGPGHGHASGVGVPSRPGGRRPPVLGCLGGQGFAFVSHVGIVQICGFLDTPAGDLRANGFDFHAIWRDAPLFQAMRRRAEYHGRCGVCEYRQVCGGCRARAFAMGGDALGEEPFCTHVPGRAVTDDTARGPEPRRPGAAGDVA
ncbi:MAG: radical SAM protein [Deltaproteobacteria bacterium]|nr:radical SAM protein [Deltaproteobacteria bacterium]